MPTILLLCESGTAEKRAQRYVRAQLRRSDMEELPVYTSTASALQNMNAERIIWTSIEDTDELLELAALV